MLPGIMSAIMGRGASFRPLVATHRSSQIVTANTDAPVSGSIAIGTASADRRVFIAFQATSFSLVSFLSMTVNGSGVTTYVNTPARFGNVAGQPYIITGFAQVLVPTGTTASIAWSFSGAVSDISFSVFTTTGDLISAAPQGDGVISDQSNTSRTSASMSANTVPAGGIMMAVAATNSGGAAIGWTNATEALEYDMRDSVGDPGNRGANAYSNPGADSAGPIATLGGASILYLNAIIWR